jgi:hypothetical protein
MACSAGVCGRNNMAKPKSSFWSGTPGYSSNIPLQSPQQAQLANLLGQSAQGVLSGGLKPNYSGFEPIANQARSQFYQDIVPTLAERFTAMGGGAQSSSAFPAALSSAGSELSQGLAALQSQYGMNAKSGSAVEITTGFIGRSDAAPIRKPIHTCTARI